MATFKIKVDEKTGQTYIPKELRDDGFVGELEVRPSIFTATLVKPGASLEQVKQSLELEIKGLELIT